MNTIHFDDATGFITIQKDQLRLDPSNYQQWALGAQVLRTFQDISEAQGLELFLQWSQQGATNGEAYSDQAATAMWNRGRPVTGTLVNTRISNAPLLERLDTLRQGLLLNQWADAADVVSQAVEQLKKAASPQPTTPAEAATDTTMQLLQQGLLEPEQVLQILHDSQRPGELLQYGVDYLERCFEGFESLQLFVHQWAVRAGWWSNIETGQPKERNDGELLLLMVSEIIEGFEGLRKNLMDDKLVTRSMIEVEIADVFIRGLDYAGGRKLDLAGAIRDKMAYNLMRADHKVENRLKADGKKF